jgi:hypothetical protein
VVKVGKMCLILWKKVFIMVDEGQKRTVFGERKIRGTGNGNRDKAIYGVSFTGEEGFEKYTGVIQA